MKKGLLATSAVACTFIAGFATSASATMLETFEQMILADTPDGAFTYESVISDTDDGFEITGVRIVEAPGEPEVTIDRLRIGGMDMDALNNEGMPAFIDVEAENIHWPAESMDPDGREMFPDGATFDLVVDYELDQEGTLSLDEFSLAMDDFGMISLSLELTGMSEEAVMGMMFTGPEALGEATLSSLSITIDDDGMLAVFFGLGAEESGMDVATFVETEVLGSMQMGSQMFAADPIGSAIVTAVMDFLADYDEPGGPLTISANPDTPVGFPQVMGVMMGAVDPTTLPGLLGLSATYDKEGEAENGGGLFGNN